MEQTRVAGKRVTVMGLGRFGGQIAGARWLAGQGAKVLVTDTTPPEKLADSVRQLEGLGIEYRLGEHRIEDFSSAELVMASPAVPPENPYLAAARGAGVPIVTEIELFLERNPARTVIGVTGTKGKSTTTAMLGRMLATRNRTHVGGNIGRPLIGTIEKITPDDWVLLELSSYMLHYLGARRFRPNLALVTMVSADHLDWHGGAEAYVNAKVNLVAHQLPEDHAIVYAQNPSTPVFAGATRAQFATYDGRTNPRVELLLPGEHNQVNAQGALLAALTLGVDDAAARDAVRGFGGLPHRLELVCERGGVTYYNDSIATIPEAAVVALESFPPSRVIQIVGGYDKHLDMTPMVEALARRAKAALCIGALGPSLADRIGPRAENCATLDAAIARARNIATPGDIVLLSTGCASYDQFANFESRGDRFRELALGGL
jgi:UDP-N-acetylmuramoylalanine--D-glutamate ligase